MNKTVVMDVRTLSEFYDKYLQEYNIPSCFSNEKIEVKDYFEDNFNGERRDLRSLYCFTIDGEDSKDFDDAISIEMNEQGYTVGVHIADVSNYVLQYSKLDDVCYERGCSIYLPHLTFNMLPNHLSNNLCSLNPDEDKLTISIMIDLDKKCNVLGYSICKSMIRSRKRMTYNEVDNIIRAGFNNDINDKVNSNLLCQLYHMREVALKLRNKRLLSGAKFCSDRGFKFYANRKCIFLEATITNDANKIVEEFMVLANSKVGEFLDNNGLPSINRVQDGLYENAYYSDELTYHYSLALDNYVHFTSPIRRLADLKNHQVLTAYLAGESVENIINQFEEDIYECSLQATKKMRNAEQLGSICYNYCVKKWAEKENDKMYEANVVRYTMKGDYIFSILPYNISFLGHSSIKRKIGEKIQCNLVLLPNKKRVVAQAI